MKEKTIEKSAVVDFLSDLLETGQVFAPVEREGIVNFELLRSGEEARLGLGNSLRPPKELFFPCSETLFAFEHGEVTAKSSNDEPRVIFGIRPCDAAGLRILDEVLLADDSQDPSYAGRRERSVLVGLGCDQPAGSCFCTSLGGGPFAAEGLDLLFTDLGEKYLVEAVSQRGEDLVAGRGCFEDASHEDIELKREIATRAEQSVSGPNVQGVKQKLDGMFDDPFWDYLHLKCLGCGICTYLCPTCHCFDIVDEGTSDNGQRVRVWDSCQFSQFTLHTSGHNPRLSGKQRMRQRVMHKFKYFVDNFGEVACVGCGRCVRECPVNLDIRAVVDAIRLS